MNIYIYIHIYIYTDNDIMCIYFICMYIIYIYCTYTFIKCYDLKTQESHTMRTSITKVGGHRVRVHLWEGHISCPVQHSPLSFLVIGSEIPRDSYVFLANSSTSRILFTEFQSSCLPCVLSLRSCCQGTPLSSRRAMCWAQSNASLHSSPARCISIFLQDTTWVHGWCWIAGLVQNVRTSQAAWQVMEVSWRQRSFLWMCCASWLSWLNAVATATSLCETIKRSLSIHWTGVRSRCTGLLSKAGQKGAVFGERHSTLEAS